MNNTFMDRVNAIVQKNQPASMPIQAPESYPDQGMGALSNVVSGAPRQTEIMGQPHMLAYINPQEEQMLRNAGGAGLPGPDGVPAYWFHSGWGGGSTTTSNNSSSNNDGPAPTTFYNDYSDPDNPVLDTMSAVEARRSNNNDDKPAAPQTQATSSSGNSFTESVANFFTPNDGASYVNGQLVDDNTGARISSGGTTSTGNVISGIANSESNDIQGPMPAGTDFTGSQIGQDNDVADPYDSSGNLTVPYDTSTGKFTDPVVITPSVSTPSVSTPSVSTPSVSTPSVSTPNTPSLPEIINVPAPPSGTDQNTGAQPVYLQPNTAGALPQETTLADVQQKLNAAISEAQSAAGSNNPENYWNDEIAQLAAQRDRIRDSGTESTGSLSDIKADLTLTGNDSGAFSFLPEGGNTLGQTIINALTPFGSMEYINGVLVDTDAGDFTSNPSAANNASGYVNAAAGAGSALLDSAYAKIAAGNASDLTMAEQSALYGQRGTVPNAAETVALQENYKASGERTMTQDMQDEIVSGMVDNGATQAQIDAYKEGSPVGSDANPFYDTYGELGVFGKIGKGVGDLLNYAVTNATYGLINPQKLNEAAADDFVRAYESEGSTGGQFDWNDPNYLDISPGALGDANWEKLLEMSSSETGIEPSLQGVVGEDGETVSGVVEVKNTKDGPEIVTGNDDDDDITPITGGGDDDDGVTTVDPAKLSAIWKRYYKGSGMEFLPPWMRKWASGEEIDLILTKVEVDGKEYYQTPDGQYIDPAELVGTKEEDVNEGGTETSTETEE
jgi:hypothetical protein